LPASSFTTAPVGATLNIASLRQPTGYPTVSTLMAGTFLPGIAGAPCPPAAIDALGAAWLVVAVGAPSMGAGFPS
jgi:hypothetical protein